MITPSSFKTRLAASSAVKCQGAAARDWLAAREADLLPVGYFHVVFALPAEIAAIAYPLAPNSSSSPLGGRQGNEGSTPIFKE
jgi:hypothetical protein